MNGTAREILASATRANQGECLVRHVLRWWIVRTPDGVVELCKSKDAAESRCKAWFKRHAKADINFGSILWEEA